MSLPTVTGFSPARIEQQILVSALRTNQAFNVLSFRLHPERGRN